MFSPPVEKNHQDVVLTNNCSLYTNYPPTPPCVHYCKSPCVLESEREEREDKGNRQLFIATLPPEGMERVEILLRRFCLSDSPLLEERNEVRECVCVCVCTRARVKQG